VSERGRSGRQRRGRLIAPLRLTARLVRGVLSRDPKDALEPRGRGSTRPEDNARAILADVLQRWPIEVPCAEAWAPRGVETPRPWSDRALAWETPCLCGLSSLVTRRGRALPQQRPLALRSAAWYPKAQATSSDVPAAVRGPC
jgi:hypothetical protein